MLFNCGVGEDSLRVPWTARRSNQSILKEISPECSLEGLMLKLKLQYFGHLMWRTDSLEKDPDAGKDWRQEEKGATEDEMVGWHHWLNGHEFEQILGDGEGQEKLVCCSPWGCKGSDTTEWLNWTETITSYVNQPPNGFLNSLQLPLSSQGDTLMMEIWTCPLSPVNTRALLLRAAPLACTVSSCSSTQHFPERG